MPGERPADDPFRSAHLQSRAARLRQGRWVWLVTEDGSRYLDLGGGIAVNALGHAHPALVAALTEQALALWHTSNLYRIPAQERLADLLVEHTFADTVFFTNSGTEACELAVKMARKYWYDQNQPARSRILTFEGAFHGRSSAAIAAAGSEKMVKGFGPLLPGFTQLPWGDHAALTAAIAAPDIAAVMVEPVQGEGGIRPLPDACLKGLRDLCDQTGVLMILDEVQCGMGRTGRLFAHEWAGIAPDIMMVAKGIGGGFPLALSSPQNGRPAAWGRAPTAPPMAAIRWAARSVRRSPASSPIRPSWPRCGGRRHCSAGSRIPRGAPSVRLRRGAGPGFDPGSQCRLPNADIVKAGYAVHLLTVPAADNVIRLLPALNIPDADLAEALNRLDARPAPSRRCPNPPRPPHLCPNTPGGPGGPPACPAREPDAALPRHSQDRPQRPARHARQRRSDEGRPWGPAARAADDDQPLKGRMVALIFEKPSTRTGCPSMWRAPDGRRDHGSVRRRSATGPWRNIADTARVLSRYVDLIMIRTFEEATLLEMAELPACR